VTCVNDPPTVGSPLPGSQTVQYSDWIETVTVVAGDIDSAPLTISVNGLPDGLTVAGNCTGASGGSTCQWTIEGQVLSGIGTYTLAVGVSDGELHSSTEATVVVLAEDASAAFPDENDVAVPVDSPGGECGEFALAVLVSETLPDAADNQAAPGDINLAEVAMTLRPVGPGSPVSGACTADPASGNGYEAVMRVGCTFDDVPVNTYTVEATAAGDYYTGYAEDVLVVYDPSLGFTTGGGWFYWPGTDHRTNFGYTMKYNKKATNIQGSLLLISHLPDGTKYRVKSNALYGLALGEADDGEPFGWASFSGKSTYLEPGWPEPVGNHEFVVYVEDRDEPGTGVDRFWIELHDKNGNVIDALSMPREAYDNTESLGGGNIVVPH
jgi:hypothetical protein